MTETRTQKDKPLITVVGVLGKQGYSVASSLLQSTRYRIRGITRQVDSLKAKSLIKQGAELVSVPLDLGHKKDFIKAFRNSAAIFMLTPSIAPPLTHEMELGMELADAAVEAGVSRIIFSSLENVEKITGGKKFAPHFTDKAKIEEYIRTLPITSSFIYMALFYTNLTEFYLPYTKGDTLVFPIYLPKDFRAPFVDPLTATGPAVLEILNNPSQYAGKSLPVVGDIISPQEMVDTFVRVTGKKAVYMPAFTQKNFLYHFPEFSANELLVREILGMVEYTVEYGYFGKERDWQWSRRTNPESLSWEQFLRNIAWDGQKRTY